jgi:ubiquinone/menaquinone biosynthesis C-methylase UbiE
MAVSETFYDMSGLVLSLVRGRTIIDLGSGLGAWGYAIKCRFNEVYLIGLDVDLENLMYVGRHSVYDDLVLACLPWIPFRDKSADTILCCDVIEHLRKSEGLKLIQEMERVARRRIIVTTPSPRIVFSNPEHVSSWSARDFKKLGFRVLGVRFRYHALLGGNLKFILYWLFELLSRLVTYFASTLITYKDLDDRHDQSKDSNS